MVWANYRNALAKTSHGGQSLYDHTLQCVEAGMLLAPLFPDYSQARLDTLILGLCIHDVGKLDPNFQAMLRARLQGKPLPKRKVKHESRTFASNHVSLVENNLEEIAKELKANFDYGLKIEHLTREDLEWAWAFATTHHGMYYVSYERSEDGKIKRQARRQWTSFTPLEARRLTLVDLLFHFHPIGGLVIMSDLIASYAFEQELDLSSFFSDARTLADVFDNLFDHSEAIEASLQEYDPRDYGLRDLLQLLATNVVPARGKS